MLFLQLQQLHQETFDDVKSVFMDANTAPNFVANFVLSNNTYTWWFCNSMNGSNANVTGFNTTFTKT